MPPTPSPPREIKQKRFSKNSGECSPICLRMLIEERTTTNDFVSQPTLVLF